MTQQVKPTAPQVDVETDLDQSYISPAFEQAFNSQDAQTEDVIEVDHVPEVQEDSGPFLNESDELGPRVRGDAREEPLSGEIATQGPDVAACLRTTITALTGPDRPPSMNAAKTLERSATFWTAVEPLKRDLLERVRADAGGVDDAPETLLGLQDAYAEARLFRTSMFLRLVDSGGPVTGKGRTKALYKSYRDALSDEIKLATTLGLERKARKVMTVSELLTSGGRHEER